ncbi:hypothetical protein MnTg02_02655 [bacterium MnTg02]|nr:hypothetical protein MnTg02_02655 [bacterium MnTg02]
MRREQFRVDLKARVAAASVSVVLVPVFILFVWLTSDVATSDPSRERTLSLYNIHTKRAIKVTYKRDGVYIPRAMAEINKTMGDWRRNESIKIDPKLIDLIWSIHSELGSKKPIHLISGYRSRKTNNKLRRTRGGQARNSRHILGKAADVHFPDIPVKRLRNSALIRERGGVGYYPTSALPFVHVDTGRVRHWPRLARHELAALFPSGRSKHVPKDGRRITKHDYKVAMARLNTRQKNEIRLARGGIGRNRLPTTAKRQGPVLASLAGGKLPWTKKARPPQPQKAKPQPARYQLASADPSVGIAYRHENLSRTEPSLPAPPSVTGTEGWARAPAYDDEHPDELSYRPFPILQLLVEESISKSTNLTRLTYPDHTKVHLLLGEPDKIIPLRFRPGLQYAEMLWASQFKGSAVPKALSHPTYAGTPKQKSLKRTARR